MEPKAALELLVAGLNRAAFNPIEQAGLNAAVAVLLKALEPAKPKEDEPPKP